jgi:hypothetical protein
MHDDFDRQEIEYGPESECPSGVKIAATVWIVIGSIILLNGLASLLLSFATAAEGPGGPIGGFCGLLLAALFGGVFIHVGLQSLQGTARDTLGNGVGSIIIGFLNLGGGVMVALAGLAAGGPALVVGMITGIISLLGGIGLVVAGILALANRTQYKAWRKAKKAAGKRG